MADVTALYAAIAQLTQQVQLMAEHGSQRGGPGKSWDEYGRYKNLKVFSGEVKDFEEWSVKFRSVVAAGNTNVNKLMLLVEQDYAGAKP